MIILILEFSIANFLSFKDKVTFSMVGDNTLELPNNYIGKDKHKILKTAAIYGANASGKSNLLKVVSLVVTMLRNSNALEEGMKLPIVPFKKNNDAIKFPSFFEIKFVVDDIRYDYGFEADEFAVYSEYLYYYPHGRETKIFCKKAMEYSFPQKDEKILTEIAAKNGYNKFFLASATNWNYAKTKPAYDFLTKAIKTCFNVGELKYPAFSEYACETPALKNFALQVLQEADLNIADFQITQMNFPNDFANYLRPFANYQTRLSDFI